MMEATLGRLAVTAVHGPLQLLTALNLMAPLWPPQADVHDGDIFDFIIVGSGMGSIVANRLTENKKWSVLLIEAGKNPSAESMFPGALWTLQSSYQDWNYKSEVEEASQSQQNDVFRIHVGKSLGGSTAINNFMVTRAPQFDFDSWANYLNDSSWEYKNILQYFKKCETMEDETILTSKYRKFHGTNGPLRFTRPTHKYAKKYLEAFREAGKPVVLDNNGNDTMGYTESVVMIADNIRQHTGEAYLKPIKHRKNLHVYTETLVTKINFENKIAKSVQIINKYNKTMTVRVRKEIILCAGTINTPKLLIHSGVGPADTLRRIAIPPVSVLPVGMRLYDHTAVPIVHKVDKSSEVIELPSLGKIPFPLIVGGVAIDKSKPYPDYQGMSFVLTHAFPYLLLTCSMLYGYKDEICQEFHDGSDGKDTVLNFVSLESPKSSGLVTVRSADPMEDPIIKESFYSDPSDLENMARYIEDFLSIGETTHFRSINAELVKLRLPQCSSFTYNSTEYWKCYAKSTSTGFHHYTSTCGMGKVVDSEGQVYGVKQLSVVDASILPSMPRANPVATVIMTAEKLSDVIKARHKCCEENLFEEGN